VLKEKWTRLLAEVPEISLQDSPVRSRQEFLESPKPDELDALLTTHLEKIDSEADTEHVLKIASTQLRSSIRMGEYYFSTLNRRRKSIDRFPTNCFPDSHTIIARRNYRDSIKPPTVIHEILNAYRNLRKLTYDLDDSPDSDTVYHLDSPDPKDLSVRLLSMLLLQCGFESFQSNCIGIIYDLFVSLIHRLALAISLYRNNSHDIPFVVHCPLKSHH
jgi:hypothetical protein